MLRLFALALLVSLSAPAALAQAGTDDPFLWLEDVEGAEALAWVEARNAETLAALRAHPAFQTIYDDALRILSAQDRIAMPAMRGAWISNVWTDARNPRGVWRRASWDAYLAGAPDWQTLLDIDALGAAENVNWALGGTVCQGPAYRRCLVRLSRGGADATEVREFDTDARRFVEGGFRLAESKSSVAWADDATLLVADATEATGALTTSGYPRLVRLWPRGTHLGAQPVLLEIPETDMGLFVATLPTATGAIPVVQHVPSFFERVTYVVREGALVRVDLPLDANPSIVSGQLVVYLRSPWETGGTTHAAGSLIAMDFERFLAGERDFTPVAAPGERQTINAVSTTRASVIVSLLTNVTGELVRYRYHDGAWRGEPVQAPAQGTLSVVSTGPETDRFFFVHTGFLTPTTLYLAEADGSVREVQRLPAQFDASGLVVRQEEATSRDGTRVPYFLVHREGLALDGSNPTLLYAYGGFEVSLTPSYSSVMGKSWLERGGVYVVANIRGGGEFGPQWHRAALKENRQRAYDDFIAVAEALVASGVTSPERLGIEGGSNGGLLTGVAMTQRPDLFNAVLIHVPLLDMQRYHRLLAGASWMAEYGNPDVPEEWAYIQRYSPYHNLRPGVRYPMPLITTTTRDDRVHPGHARKMAARMNAMGLPVLYFENTEGGHGSGVTPEQQALRHAVVYSYLLDRLFD
ncbi:MAG: prolyl oligopeptidase family serine peptidase [Rubricoccaceae bacterium]